MGMSMTHRINRAAAVAAIIAALGASQVASAKAYLPPYSAEVFRVTAPDPTAKTFTGFYVLDTFAQSAEPVHERVLHDLDELLFNTTIVGLDAAALQLSFVQGVTGVLNNGTTVVGGTLAVTQPGFDVADPYQGGKPPSAATNVPEPATGLLLLIGASALVAGRRRPR